MVQGCCAGFCVECRGAAVVQEEYDNCGVALRTRKMKRALAFSVEFHHEFQPHFRFHGSQNNFCARGKPALADVVQGQQVGIVGVVSEGSAGRVEQLDVSVVTSRDGAPQVVELQEVYDGGVAHDVHVAENGCKPCLEQLLAFADDFWVALYFLGGEEKLRGPDADKFWEQGFL